MLRHESQDIKNFEYRASSGSTTAFLPTDRSTSAESSFYNSGEHRDHTEAAPVEGRSSGLRQVNAKSFLPNEVGQESLSTSRAGRPDSLLRFDQEYSQKVQFSDDVQPSARRFMAGGRRRSKSQGQILPGRSGYGSELELLSDFDALNLEDSFAEDLLERPRSQAANPFSGGLAKDGLHDWATHGRDGGLDSEVDAYLSKTIQGGNRNRMVGSPIGRVMSSSVFNATKNRPESDMGGVYSHRTERPLTDFVHSKQVASNAEPLALGARVRDPPGSALGLYDVAQRSVTPAAASGLSSNPLASNNVSYQQQQQPGESYRDIRSPVSSVKKHSAPGSNKGDWICLACGNTNYSWRHVCNMRKCRAPKPGYAMEQVPPGSWACLACGNLNYAERVVCNMRKCRAPKPPSISNFDPRQMNGYPMQAYPPRVPSSHNMGVMPRSVAGPDMFGGQTMPQFQRQGSVNSIGFSSLHGYADLSPMASFYGGSTAQNGGFSQKYEYAADNRNK